MSEHHTAAITQELSRFVLETSLSDISTETKHAASRAFVNIIGCMLSGSQHELVDVTARALLPFGGTPASSLVGRPEKTDMLTAALINCLSSAAYSFDDTHSATMLHPSGATAAALLALSESRDMSGDEFLLAFILGVEIASRLSMAVSTPPAVGNIGWSQSGIAAGIGAAAAGAKVLGLTEQQTRAAIAIAALQSSGLRVALGTMAGSLIFAHAAQCGLRAAILAQAGMTAPSSPIEGKHGFLDLYAEQAHAPYLTENLGSRYAVTDLTYKPYPCGIVNHPAIDAALRWRQLGHDYRSINAIRLTASSNAVTLGSRRHPANPLEAKVSLCHWISAALVYGRAGIAEVEQAVINDPEVIRLREVIELTGDSNLWSEAAVLLVSTATGQEKIAIDCCKGSAANPMSDEDLDNKFRGQALLRMDEERATELLDACWRIGDFPSAAELLRLTAVN